MLVDCQVRRGGGERGGEGEKGKGGEKGRRGEGEKGRRGEGEKGRRGRLHSELKNNISHNINYQQMKLEKCGSWRSFGWDIMC